MPPTLVAMPSTALLLDEVRAGEDPAVADLRTAAAGAVPAAAVHVVVVAVDPAAPAGRPVTLAPPDGVVHLGGLGLANLHVTVPSDRPTAADRAGWVGGLADVAAHPGPDLAVLTILAARALGHGSTDADPGAGTGADAVRPAPVQLIGLPVVPDPDLAAEVAAAIQPVIAADGVVVCAADLAAGHGPKPPRPEVGESTSTGFDQAVARAVAEGDVAAIDDLAQRASSVAARGMPPLQVALRLAGAADLRPGRVHRTVVDGVGGLVCRWEGTAEAGRGEVSSGSR